MAYVDSQGLIQYLPSFVQEDYGDAVKETSGSVPGLGSFVGIKSLDDWAKHRGITPEDLNMLKSEAQSQKRSQMAMRNDPDARGFGDSWNPEYTKESFTDNPYEKLGRRGPPRNIETYEEPIWDIPQLDAKRGEYIPKEDSIKFPVGEPEIQAHEWMHRGFSFDENTKNYIIREIIQSDLGEYSDYGGFLGTVAQPLKDIQHLYILEKTAPEFYTDKTDKVIKSMDKETRDEYLKNNFSKLFPEYKDEEKFAAFRKAVVEKIDSRIEPKSEETPRVSANHMNYGDYGRSYI